MRAGHQKDKAMIRNLEFSAPHPILQRGREAGNGVNDGSCLHDKVSIKPQTYRVQRASFRVGEHVEV